MITILDFLEKRIEIKGARKVILNGSTLHRTTGKKERLKEYRAMRKRYSNYDRS